MTAKLTPLLDKLLSSSQSGFLQGRSILHAFHYVQQIIQTAHVQQAQLAIFKADIFKAFDTLNWHFVSLSLKARGFPLPWISSIQNRILQGSSRILLNSVAGKSITLKRGVRQGDPISPYIFNLSIDFLSIWIQRLTALGFLASPVPNCPTCILYADDTLLFLKPNRSQMLRAKLLFDIFGDISGLKVNLYKSELAGTSAPFSLIQSLAAHIGCTPVTLPFKYLGLPLSDRRLNKTEYFPLIDKIETALAGWKSPLLSVGGRYILTNAVLTAIPQYFMSIFHLPTWVIRKIDKIRKRFLWHGSKDRQHQNRALYMVNWAVATKPRQIGGMGIRDIKIANQSLLLKWMWLWKSQPNAWWTKATILTDASDTPWNYPNATPFWKNIKSLQPIFDCSVLYKIGNGHNTKFWHDAWIGDPLKFRFPNLYSEATNKHYSVAQCRNNEGWILQFPTLTILAQVQKNQLMTLLQQMDVIFNDSEDTITWTRSSNSFSAKSAYTFLANCPSPSSPLRAIWSLTLPLRVLIFTWLKMSNRLTTIDNLARRGWCLPNICIMCEADEESIHHLFHQCQLALHIRIYIQSAFSLQIPIPHKFVTPSSAELLTDPQIHRSVKVWEVTTSFVIWRERCRRIFSEQFMEPLSLVREIKSEVHNWSTGKGR